jgi:glyoxylase-like metal-dependent hydrolase (beta-lactamase superfamily II)
MNTNDRNTADGRRFVRKIARTFGTLLLVASSALHGPARAGEGDVKAVAVADDVWFVQGESALGSSANRNFISNAAFVVTPAGVLVIDALGSPVLAEELIAQIRRVTPLPIRYVVVTHFHADHIYGLQVFKAAGARIVAHGAGREYLLSDPARLRLEASRQEMAPWVDENTRLVEADQWLGGGDTVLDLGGRKFHVRHVGPAHTPEDLVVFDPQSGVLFAGDLVFRGRVPFVGQADSRRWIESLTRALEFQPRLLVPGHGPVSTQAHEDLTLTRDYLSYLRQTMGEAARNMEPFDEAYARTDWSRFEALPLFRVANRMNAYNTYLLMEHQQ